ncbi:MAG: amino acid permease [Oscillospiraceae bacterium]|nr:amino acid permease [Oscillospiraceae bacterium]
MYSNTNSAKAPQNTRYLSPVNVWALSFGCAVGWGAFVMPGTTFLPSAGPWGTALGIGFGAVVMLIIGMNYHFMMNKYPDAGGTLTYTAKTFGYDHGFLSAWFLLLVYVAIIWANATALTLIARYLLGGMFQFGFHYVILGYDVYLGEALLSMAALLLFGLLCAHSKRLTICVQTVLAVLLFGGVLICAVTVLGHGGVSDLKPAFSPNGGNPFAQVCGIVALSPWAFAGFESVSNSTADFRFSTKKSIGIMGAALVTGAISYILLTWIAAVALPDGYADWAAYIADLGRLDGLNGLPTFYAAQSAMGQTGLLVLGVTVCAGIITGLVGNYVAASRLMLAMADDGILPRWFGRVTGEGNPGNALYFLTVLSLFIPLAGRTAIGWIIDVNTIGAVIAYGYTSASAITCARREKKRKYLVTGVIGAAMSVVFFFYFMSWKAGAMATESYLILAFWSILGFVFFLYVFKEDKAKRFGKSTVVWIGLLFLIFFTSLMWIKQATRDMTAAVAENISTFYEERSPDNDSEATAEAERYISEQMRTANRTQTRNSVVQMLLIVASLAIMFSIYHIMSKREKQSEADKIRAEENSRAKTVFLSNMSHDIRTPMNAILGYTNLARRDGTSAAEMREYLDKIDSSGHHLLALINDVLEMSRIESGKMELEPVPVDLKRAFSEVRDMFATQMKEKSISFTVDTNHVKRNRVLCDKNRLNRVLLNLLSNAYKFTPEGGSISVTVWEIESEKKDWGNYEIRVADNGIGMTSEFAAKVFEAFERERTSTVSGIQGTGLGMAITKSIIDKMGGEIEVNSAPGIGTEFVVKLELELLPDDEKAVEDTEEAGKVAPVDFTGIHLLLVEDNEINREIATMILEESGFTLDTAVNGEEAVEKVTASQPGDYAAVLMDIQMPKMNGYEATRAIRALTDPRLAEIPIIAMTANAFSEDIKAAEDAGMDGHIAKPLDISIMINTLTDILRRKRA